MIQIYIRQKVYKFDLSQTKESTKLQFFENFDLNHSKSKSQLFQ